MKRKRPEPCAILRAHTSSVQAVEYVYSIDSFDLKEENYMMENDRNHLNNKIEMDRGLNWTKKDKEMQVSSSDSSFSLSPSPGYLFSGDAEGLVHLWNLQTRRVVGSIDARNMISDLSFLNNSRSVNVKEEERIKKELVSNFIDPVPTNLKKPKQKHLEGIMGIFQPSLSVFNEKEIEINSNEEKEVIIQRRDGWIGIYKYSLPTPFSSFHYQNQNQNYSFCCNFDRSPIAANYFEFRLVNAFPSHSYHYCKAAIERWHDADASPSSLTSKTLIAVPCDDVGSIAVYDYSLYKPTQPIRYLFPLSTNPSSSSSSFTSLPNMNNSSNKGLCMSMVMHDGVLFVGYESGSLCIFDVTTSKVLSDSKVSENSILSIDVSPDGKQGIVGTTGEDLVFFDLEWRFFPRTDRKQLNGEERIKIKGANEQEIVIQNHQQYDLENLGNKNQKIATIPTTTTTATTPTTIPITTQATPLITRTKTRTSIQAETIATTTELKNRSRELERNVEREKLDLTSSNGPELIFTKDFEWKRQLESTNKTLNMNMATNTTAPVASKSLLGDMFSKKDVNQQEFYQKKNGDNYVDIGVDMDIQKSSIFDDNTNNNKKKNKNNNDKNEKKKDTLETENEKLYVPKREIERGRQRDKVTSIKIMNQVSVQQKRPGTSFLKLRKDNRLLLAASWDHRVQIYHHKKKKHLANLAYHKDSIYSCDYHLQTNCFAVGSKDGTISLWDLYT